MLWCTVILRTLQLLIDESHSCTLVDTTVDNMSEAPEKVDGDMEVASGGKTPVMEENGDVKLKVR